MEARNASDQQTAEVSKIAHLGLIAERIRNLEQLQGLLELSDKDDVLRRLRTITFSGNPFGLPEGFEERELSEIKGNIQELIAMLEVENNKVQGLVTAIKNGLVGTVDRTTASSDVLYTKLTPEQVKYVREAVEDGYERYKNVNRPLIREEGVPDFPAKEVVLKAALSQLTSDQLDYMMAEGGTPFSFQVKLVAPSDRIDLVHALINGQMSENQKGLSIVEMTARHLDNRKDGNSRIEWKWSFYQNPQEAWDNSDLTLQERLPAFKGQLPAGMKGTDRFDWATSLADGLKAGKPMRNEKGYSTILDEEGELREGGTGYLAVATCLPKTGRPCMTSYIASCVYRNAFLHASVDGPIDSLQ